MLVTYRAAVFSYGCTGPVGPRQAPPHTGPDKEVCDGRKDTPAAIRSHPPHGPACSTPEQAATRFFDEGTSHNPAGARAACG